MGNRLQPQLYHTYPLSCLGRIEQTTPAFIEADLCLKNNAYKQFFKYLCPSDLTMLDCGVGMSPDLNDPTGHVSSDSNWAIRYLRLVKDLNPRVVVIPDVLGNRKKTYRNIIDYYELVFSSWRLYNPPELMAVVQAHNEAQARIMLDDLLDLDYIQWVGFPRVVHYYHGPGEPLVELTGTELGNRRLRFVSDVIDTLLQSGKKVHLLGLNSIDELKWTAAKGLSCDTRLATLAAIHEFPVTGTRPAKRFSVDLLEPLSENVEQEILNNVSKLDSVFYKNARL